MCRNVLIALVIAVIVLMVVAGVVVSLYGWPGFLVLVAALIVLTVGLRYLAPRILPRLFMGAITRPMREMGKVLRGATLTVRSVTPCAAPEMTNDEDDEPERLEDRDDPDDDSDDDDEEEDEYEEPNPADLDWYEIDFTVTPKNAGSAEGRMVTRSAWNPGLLTFHMTRADRPPMPAGMPALFDQFGGPEIMLDRLETWNGSAFEEGTEEDEVFGEGRFRARVGVPRKIWTIVLLYAHFTEVGEIRIPRIDVTPGREP